MTTPLQARQERWASLLSGERPGASSYQPLPGRTEFDRDYDRLIFSSPFRYLQDKTQVFPLSPSAYTRTRLTHSLEVACVGRSLGQAAGDCLEDGGLLPEGFAPGDLGVIVSASCLAHDLGNPPFGHSGEDAIQQWAQRKIKSASLLQQFSAQEQSDLLQFEGNAQSFRVVGRLEGRERIGGLRLTFATLGSLFKYPRPSEISKETEAHFFGDVAIKKFGYFSDDQPGALAIFSKLGLPERAPGVFARHPLAFLMEAADDICYAIIDLEDAFRLKLISYEDLCDLLEPLLARPGSFSRHTNSEEETNIVVLRSMTIAELVRQCAQVFRDNIEAIEEGQFSSSLIDKSSVADAYKNLKAAARQHVYNDERVLQIEYAGYQTLGGLLDFFYDAIVVNTSSSRDRKLRRLIPSFWLRFEGEHKDTPEEYLEDLSPYRRLLSVTDYISALTDRYAVDLYQKLSGIKLPS